MFTKKDLKDGMVVETRDGCRYIVVGDRLLAEDGFLWLSEYDDALLDCVSRRESSIFDIMKVFDVTNNLSPLYKDKTEPIGLKVLFDRTDSGQRTSTTNENKAKYFCKQFASLYILLDEDKLYSHFLRILYNISAHKVSITGFDIEQCSEKDINEAVRRLGIECADYYIIRDMEVGSDQDVY